MHILRLTPLRILVICFAKLPKCKSTIPVESVSAVNATKTVHSIPIFPNSLKIDAIDDRKIPTARQKLETAVAPSWEFTSLCDFDLSESYVYVSPNGQDKKNLGYGKSTKFPFATISYAVQNREPCQTVFIMAGTYRNLNYGMSQGNNAVVKLTGVRDLKITNYQDEKVIVEFDGFGGFTGGNAASPVSNLEISGLEIIGRNERITFGEAWSNRLSDPKLNYYNGQGISIWEGHHIFIHDNIIHHCPGSGIRIQKGDYITISNNIVHSSTWWTSAGRSAIVLAESKSIDFNTGYKMFITGNIVYDNINKIPFYNPIYEWWYTPISNINCKIYQACMEGRKDGCPWECRYGKSSQDYIIDGSGVYLTRNNESYLYGKMELSFNVCFGNGINGVVFHRTNRGVVRANIVYDNGVVPRLDKTESNPQDWHVGCSGKSRQKYSGITLNVAKGVELWCNQVLARYNDDFAYMLESDGLLPVPISDGGGNIICRGMVGLPESNIVRRESNDSFCKTLQPCVMNGTESLAPSQNVIPSQIPTILSSRADFHSASISQSNLPSLSPTINSKSSLFFVPILLPSSSSSSSDINSPSLGFKSTTVPSLDTQLLMARGKSNRPINFPTTIEVDNSSSPSNDPQSEGLEKLTENTSASAYLPLEYKRDLLLVFLSILIHY